MISRITAGALIALVLLVTGTAAPAFARAPIVNNSDFQTSEKSMAEQASISSAFRSKMAVANTALVVPTVIEVPIISDNYDRRGYLVIEDQTGRLVPSYFREQYAVAPTPITVMHNGLNEAYRESLVDGDRSTGKRFELMPDGEGAQAVITITPQTPVKTSGLLFDLERNGALPTSVQVRGEDALGNSFMLLATTRMLSDRVSFISTTVRTLTVTLTYTQPLKINELTLIQDSPESTVSRGIRFLAQPGMTYTVYGNPDRAVSAVPGDSGDLISNTGVLTVSGGAFVPNEQYQPADTDGDGVHDSVDNCVVFVNADQIDIDRNGRGDACDDFDRDGVINTKDNCVNFPNQFQIDTDGDTIGDECDGEESRFTERLPWVPWVGMGIAVLVLVGLFGVVALRPVKPGADDGAV